MAPTPNVQRSAETRERIVAAARDCFVESGFAGTRIADVAKRALVGKGTIYEHWRSKEELLLDACLAACNHSESAMAELMGQGSPARAERGTVDLTAITSARGLHPVAAMHAVLHAVLSVLLNQSREEQRLFSELMTAALGQPELLQRARRELSSKYRDWIGDAHRLYLAGVEAGFFREIPCSEDAARLIVAAVDGLIWQRPWLDADGDDHLPRRMTDSWLRLHLHDPAALEEYLA